MKISPGSQPRVLLGVKYYCFWGSFLSAPGVEMLAVHTKCVFVLISKENSPGALRLAENADLCGIHISCGEIATKLQIPPILS